MSKISQNIKRQRIQKGLSQEELAEKLFVTRQTVSNYETGKSNPDLDTLIKLSEILETDVETLLYGDTACLEKKKFRRDCGLLALAAALLACVIFALQHARTMQGITFEISIAAVCFSCIGMPLLLALFGFSGAGLILGLAVRRKAQLPHRVLIRRILAAVLLAFLLWSALFLLWLSGHLPFSWLSAAVGRIYFLTSTSTAVKYLVGAAAVAAGCLWRLTEK